jgi:hypothetical protein
VVGYQINWNASASEKVLQHELYTKYASLTFGEIQPDDVKADLAGIMATTGSTAICAYLAWLLRTTAFLEE